MIAAGHCIFYLDRQEKSTAFHSAVPGRSPRLQVEGMTEFRLDPDTVLGLMSGRRTWRRVSRSEGEVRHVLRPTLPVASAHLDHQ
jgi:hypothetical protein